MNNHFPLPMRRFRAVFVVDLSYDLRALDNLIQDCGVRDDETHAELLIMAIRTVMDQWGYAYYKRPTPIIDVPLCTVQRVQHFVQRAKNFNLHRLAAILRWAPSVEIDEIWVEEGTLYFGYNTED
jgi:hypothetical protein